MTKQQVGEEIIRWMPHDEHYCRLLVAMAVVEDLITPDEAMLVKQELDQYYGPEETSDKPDKKGATMIKIGKEVGFTPARVLFNLIDLFPKYNDLDEYHMKALPADHYIINLFKFKTHDYYDVIDQLIKKGWIEKTFKKKRLYYWLNFEKLTDVYNSL